MTKYFLIAFGLFASLFAEGKLYGGFILYRQLSVNVYEISIHRFDDCDQATGTNGGTRYFDSEGYLIYHDLFGNYLYDQDTLDTQLPGASSPQAEIPYLGIDTLFNDCKVPDVNICVQHYIYVDTLSIVIPEGGLYVVHLTSQRSESFVNCSPLQSLIFYTYIPDTDEVLSNSSPVLTTEMPWYFCSNEMGYRPLTFEDPDGDSLSVEFYHPYNGLFSGIEEYPLPNPISEFTNMVYVEGYGPDVPIPGNPGLIINPVTFELSCNPNQVGAFVMGLKVTEWRNGIEIATTLYDLAAFATNCGTIQALFDTPECSGLEIPFSNESQSSEYFIWDLGLNGGLTIETSPTVEYPDAGEYLITLIAQPGSCADTLVQTIVVSPPVDVDFTSSTIDCSNGIYEINVFPDGQWPEDAVFNWSIAGGSPQNSSEINPGIIVLDPNQLASISLEVSNGWCSSLATSSMAIPAFPTVEIIPPADPCTGLAYQCFAEIEGADNYQWMISQNGDLIAESTDISPLINFPAEGLYTLFLEVESEYGCIDSSTIDIWIESNEPIIPDYIMMTPNVCDNVQVVEGFWMGSNTSNISWNLGNGIIVEDEDFLYEYSNPGLYTITLNADNLPCYDEFHEEIEIQIFPGTSIAPDYFIPNVFTPNSDDQNAMFIPSYFNQEYTQDVNWIDLTELYELVVFDRNGLKIFESTSGIPGWDGRHKGVDLPAGTYFYTLRIKFLCTESVQETSGHITLLR